MSTLFPLYLAQEDAPPVTPGSPGTPGAPVAPIGPASSTVPSNPALPPQPSAQPSPWGQIVFFAAIIGVMWFLLIGGQRKEKKKREALIASVKKGDRVQTIGGIIGTVTDVRDAEVVVKVDINNNTRITFAKSAVQTVLESEDKPQ